MMAASRSVVPLLQAAAHPSLTDLDKGDLKPETDFRSIYAGIARDWMDVDPAVVIGEEFAPVSLLG